MKFRLIILVLLLGILVAGTAALPMNGTLYVLSNPTGATILINGTDYGTTNKFVTNVPAGIQNVTLTRTGYQAETLMVDVPAGSMKVLAPVTLTKGGDGGVPPAGTGTLYVASNPTGATILINDTDYGTTNKFVTNVPAGNQNVTLTRTGYQAETLMVDVPAGSIKVLAPITLTKGGDGGVPPAGTGTLYVASNPTGATILINGTDYGTTNKFVTNVPAGNQNLMLTKTGYQAETLMVDVPAGSMKVLDPITLKKSVVGMVWPTGYGKVESEDNARGIYYNGKLYVWSIWYSSDTFVQMFHPKLFDRIEYRTFKDGQLSGPSYLWDGKSNAEPAPVIVQYPNNGPQKMFVFVTGRNGNIYFTRLNGTVWEDGDWLKIADSATGQYITTKEEGWEVAPVYDPSNHRLYLYYAKDYNDYLYVVYSDDYGNTWHNPGKVVNSPIVKSPPGAVLYHDSSNHAVLLAVKDSDQKIRICHMYLNSVDSSEVLPTPASDNIYGYGRPFLTDVGNGYIALMYAAEHGDQAYCSDWYIPHICLFDKATGQWGEPYQAATLPDLGVAQGEYQFHWQPNGAMDTDSNTFYLFYGFELCAMYTNQENNGPWWMFTSITTPGA